MKGVPTKLEQQWSASCTQQLWINGTNVKTDEFVLYLDVPNQRTREENALKGITIMQVLSEVGVLDPNRGGHRAVPVLRPPHPAERAVGATPGGDRPERH